MVNPTESVATSFQHLAKEPAGALPVRVIRSERRKKSSAARVVDGVIEVRIPSWMNDEEEQEAVASLTARIEKKRAIQETPIDLMQRARKLALVYKLPVPREIKWVTNQNTLWGSCSFNDGVIRMSSRLTAVPDWVLDYVLLHEITHLVESNHGPEFHRLMARYPKAARAEGFLEGMLYSPAPFDGYGGRS